MMRVFTLACGLFIFLSLSLQVAQSDDHVDLTYEIQTTKPDVIKVGEPATITFQVIDNVGRAQRWVSLCTEHERKLHVMVIGEDLDSFIHVHPEDFDKRPGPDDTVFSITLTFELSGRYLFMVNALLPSLTTGQCEEDHTDVAHTEAIDYWTKPGTQTPDTPIIFVNSSRENDRMAGLNDDFSLGVRIGVLHAANGVYTNPVLLSRTRLISVDDALAGKYIYVNATMWNRHGVQVTQPVVGNCTVFAFDITDRHHKPLTTLHPFLGAIAHFAIVQEGLGTSAHAHGEITMAPGANATAEQIAASQSHQGTMDFVKARCAGTGSTGTDAGSNSGHGHGQVMSASSSSSRSSDGQARVLEGHHMEVPAAFGPRLYLAVQFSQVGYHEIVGQIRISKDEIVYFDLAVVAEKAKAVGEETGIDGPFTPPTAIPTVEPPVSGSGSGGDGMKSGVIAAIVVGVLILILGIGFIVGLNYQHHRRKKYAELEMAGAVPGLQRGSVPPTSSTRLPGTSGDIEAGSTSAGRGAAALASGMGSALGVDVVDTAGSESFHSSTSSTDLDHESQSEFSEQDVVIFDRDRPTNAQPVPIKDKPPSRDITDIDSDDYDPALHAGLREQLDITGIDTSDLQNISLDN